MHRRIIPFLSLLLAGGHARAQDTDVPPSPGLAFHGMQFYAHGKGGSKLDPLAAGEGEGAAGSQFSRDFKKSSSAYIATQVVFKNRRTGDNEFDYKVIIGLYTFAGQLISAAEKALTVPPDWNYTWTSQSFGWPDSGKWDVGTYRVKVWLEGKKVGEAAFYVHDDTAKLEPGVGELEIESLGFYEGGDFFVPDVTRKPATRFARSRARRIYWVVRAKNGLHRTRPHRPNVAGYFYRPDGTLFAEAASGAIISPEVAEVTLVEGAGWPEPGKWEPGEYRFELEQDNKVIAERKFTISDPLTPPRTRPAVVHFGLLDAGLYAAGDGADEPAAPSARKYSRRFEPEGLGELWAEIVVVNNPNHTAAHTHRVEWRWIGPGGELAKRSEGDFVIQPAWKTATHRVSHGGGDPPMKWQPGAYKVLVSIDGQLYGVLRFGLGTGA